MQALLFGQVQGSSRLGGQFNTHFEIVVWQTEIRAQFKRKAKMGELQIVQILANTCQWLLH